MKNLNLIVLLFICSQLNLAAQTYNFNIMNGSPNNHSTKDDNVFSINGISSKEDIGGASAFCVSVGINYDGSMDIPPLMNKMYKNTDFYYKFKNDNPFPVTIVYRADWKGTIRHTGTLTLKANEEKIIRPSDSYNTNQIYIITRRLSNITDPVAEIKKYKQLLEQKIITQEEFDRKKKEILGL